jgi:hypothetical protein
MGLLRGDISALANNASKKTGLTDFWRFISSELVMSLINFNVLMFRD